MTKLVMEVDSSVFNLLWKSLHDRENALLALVEQHGEDSDEGADALNDLVILRLYKKELRAEGEKIFPQSAFVTEDEYL